MKILMISNSFPDSLGSYRGIFIHRLSSELHRLGHSVIVLAPKIFRDVPSKEVLDGIMVNRFWYPSGNRPLGQSGKVPNLAMVVYMISGTINAIKIILKQRPNIIHGHWIVPTGLIASVAGFITGLPVVNTAHGMDIRIAKKPFIGLLFNLAVRLSTRTTVVSEIMRSTTGLENSETIPFGVDNAFFALRGEKRGNIVISTRNLEPIYNIDTLIKAIPYVTASVTDARFIIVGQGSMDTYLKKLAYEMGVSDRIEFKGRVQNREIAFLMNLARVYVSTSLMDGTSISLLEAMAAGLIPVVTDIDANRPWITHEVDGYLFRPDKPEDLAASIVKALRGNINPSNLEEKRYRLENMVTWDSVVKQFVRVYQNIIHQKRG
ncbi:MAG: hypothetical protein DRG37_01915 [Deltaproteobacteria bacterium]|nr:MAG: hypothetical protein DRG37_01915 [Deltaproteobacteria bacterium]